MTLPTGMGEVPEYESTGCESQITVNSTLFKSYPFSCVFVIVLLIFVGFFFFAFSCTCQPFVSHNIFCVVVCEHLYNVRCDHLKS